VFRASVAVLSDAHLGERNSWLEKQAVQDGVISALNARPTVGTLVLLGDTLDLNLGPLVTGVEGRLRDSGRRPGLRSFLREVCSRTAIGGIVYVVGNHDYAVWDWEATQRNALTPLSRGESLHGAVVMSDTFPDPFLAGLLPDAKRHMLSLAFPHYLATIGTHRVVMTHGHHLDRVQTEGIALTDLPKASDPQVFLRNLTIASAQYQTFAHALSIRRRTRAELHRLYWGLAPIYDFLVSAYKASRGLRKHAPSAAVLRAVDVYVHCVAAEPSASAFVFGHTHVPGKWMTKGDANRGWRPVCVYNSGSFVPPRGMDSSLLLLGLEGEQLVGDLVGFTSAGAEKTLPLC